jgi:hypothetical protein
VPATFGYPDVRGRATPGRREQVVGRSLPGFLARALAVTAEGLTAPATLLQPIDHLLWLVAEVAATIARLEERGWPPPCQKLLYSPQHKKLRSVTYLPCRSHLP